ncbi:alpha-1,2-fucosyltransferase [Amphritea japonica]|uniref:Glycosyl transferase family 11 n=1 Tax=Amphritea japonica ATCC BAA-1530 TaxID=1278309 RepID=A0A7R6PB22_9GAMM|nr:alpha-1,2-fucosyltransferase [Amphritea japonica]BBB24806.1 glycosyl transferase family 11 [Amphritea japonica ATCC BAA-1530]
MVIVRLIGGLGNQLFQYAYALSLLEQGYDVKLDASAFESYTLHGGFGLGEYAERLEVATTEEVDMVSRVGRISTLLRKLQGKKSRRVIKESNFSYDEKMLTPEDSHYLVGYFQSELYFNKIRGELLSALDLKHKLSPYTEASYLAIADASVSVSMHIRRGDYVSDKAAHNTHGVCSLDYYYAAVTFFEERYPDVDFYIFSDDIEWVKENLNVQRAHYISSEEKRFAGEDIYLMSQCDHNIVANSSFSWWGAWLNANEDKIVVAPRQWYADSNMQRLSKTLVPDTWIRL